MNKLNKNFNNIKSGFTHTPNFGVTSKRGGFTLLETLVAIFMLTIALSSLLTLITSSLFAAKYAKNELTANYLAQEAVDYIRNDRDSTAFQNGSWAGFLDHYGDYNASTFCYSATGCSFEVTDWSYNLGTDIVYCDPNLITLFGVLKCPQFFMEKTLPTTAYYHYNSGSPNVISVPFKRQIHLDLANAGDEVRITVTVEWRNGSVSKSQKIHSSLLKWK